MDSSLFLELADHLCMMEDWPRDQMGEPRHENHVFDEAEMFDLAFPGVYEKGNLREGVEADTDRQQNLPRDRVSEPCGEVFDEEPGVFEIGEDCEVGRHSCGRSEACQARIPCLDYHPSGEIIAEDRQGQDDRRKRAMVAMDQIGGSVKGEGCNRQPGQCQHAPLRPSGVEANNRKRQKGEKELVGIEQHQAGHSILARAASRIGPSNSAALPGFL